jgi:hypothetical protein
MARDWKSKTPRTKLLVAIAIVSATGVTANAQTCTGVCTYTGALQTLAGHVKPFNCLAVVFRVAIHDPQIVLGQRADRLIF